MTVDLDSTVCEVCGKAKQGAALWPYQGVGLSPAGGGASRHRRGAAFSRMRSGSSQSGQEHFAREALARVRRLAADASVTVRADSGFFSYDMIAAIGAHNACYSITIPQNAKVKAANEAIGERRLEGDRVHPRRQRPRWLRPPSSRRTARRQTTARRRRQSGQAAPRHAAQPRARRPGRAVARLALPQLRHRQRRPRHQSSRRLPPKPRHSRARHQRPQRRLRAQPLPLGHGSSPTAPGSPAASSRTTSPAGPPASAAPTPRASSPSRPPSATGSSPCRAASSTTAAATDCACRSTGPGQTPSPPPWDTNPQPAPTHLTRRTAPGAAQPNPTRPQPAPDTTHSDPARPKTRRPAHTHQPSTNQPDTSPPTQTRRWIQA